MTRDLTTLEMLLLALIGTAGLRTIYALRQEARLSWGGIRPSLLRLEGWGLITRGKAGSRRRREFTVTDLGKKLLETQSLGMLDPRAEIDTIVRGAWVAALQNPKIAIGFVSVAADERLRTLERELADRGTEPPGPIGKYRWMLSFCRERQLKAEASLLREFADALAELEQSR